MSERLHEIGEFGMLDRFPAWFAAMAQPAVIVGPGDDCAVLRAALDDAAAPAIVFTTDALIEGTHFRADWCTPEDIGWRALAAATSDVAAMGGRPLGAVVALATPAATPTTQLEAFGAGLRAAGAFAGCPIVGGNLARGPQWHVTTSVVGTAGGRWLRSGARPGDGVWVSGRPGRAHAGLRALQTGLLPTDPGVGGALAAFRRPKPRFLVAEAALAVGAEVHAAIDLSDSLARTAERIASASGVAVHLDAGSLPHDVETAEVAARLDEPVQHYLLHGGESFELCLVGPDAPLSALGPELLETGLEWTRVGSVRAGAGVALVSDGDTRPLEPDGDPHFGTSPR